MTPQVGQVIRLKDARGCWRLHTVQPGDRDVDGAFELAIEVWRGLHFFLDFAAHADEPARYRTVRPVIGPAGAPYSPLYLPLGWHPPSVAPARPA